MKTLDGLWILIVTIAVGGGSEGVRAYHSPSDQQGSMVKVDEEAVVDPSTFHVVSDCVTISVDEGVFHFRSKGSRATCGLYLLAPSNKVIRVTVEFMNVDCAAEGLLSVVDGWELNGELFPSPQDHQKTLPARFNEFCGKESKTRRSFTSSQNAALLQYRIPTIGDGFSLRVHHLHNNRPCNILVDETEAIFTLQNEGREVNCSLTTLFEAQVRILHLNVGTERSPLRSLLQVRESETLHQCTKRGLGDYVEVGGGSGIDSSKIGVLEEVCGYDRHPGPYMRIFCGMTTIRLVSSGHFRNKILVKVRRASLDELDLADLICGF